MLGRKGEHLGRHAPPAHDRACDVHLAEDQWEGVDRHDRLRECQQHKRPVVGHQGQELVPVGVLPDTSHQEKVDRPGRSLILVGVLGARLVFF